MFRVSPASIGKFLLLFSWAASAAAAQVDEATADAKWDSVALEAALAYARDQRSSAVVIVHSGEIIAERYWEVEANPGSAYANMLWGMTDAGQPVEDVASLQKSIVSVLVGMALDRGLLDLHAPVSSYLGEGWSTATTEQESAIEIRHLLSMTSGLSPELSYVAPAGTAWLYNTRAYSKLVSVLEAVTEQGIAVLTRNWLTRPLGMSDTEWRPRPWVTNGMDANPLGLYTTARDLLRFGEMMRHSGVWQGQRLVSEDYLQAATAPSQTLNLAYGYLWWLNTRASGESNQTALIPAAPADFYSARGALGRKVYIVPSLDLVVVRLGDEPGDDFDRRFWALLMAAAPDGDSGHRRDSTIE